MTAGPTSIGPYELGQELGRGGMGIVYLARDTRLDRDVAVKALPEHLASDPERLSRFEREAKTLAQLNHPNIAAIYGIERADNATYLVLEYVEGQTLAEILDQGALQVDDAIDIAIGIAAGVEAAHEAGVIHRDLKPGNIKITPDGKVKVLDFGLARAEENSSSSSSMTLTQSASPTMTSPVMHSPTIPGAILGTAPYMSPEQARGRPVDKRSDVWSFGVVLYEMLTGIGPFKGETATDSIGAILHKDVDLDTLPPGSPRALRRVLERCLVRKRDQRLRDIGDARIELEHARDAAPDQQVAAPRAKLSAPLLILIALIALAAGAVGMRLVTPAPPPDPVIRAAILPAPGSSIVHVGDLAGPAIISPDGKKVAFSARNEDSDRRIWVRSLDSTDVRELRGTDGASHPFWSHDGKSIGFFSQSLLKRVDLDTGVVRTIAPAPGGRGGAWLEDGTILFSPRFQSPIVRIAADGGPETPVTTVDASRHTSHRWPRDIGGGKFTYLAVNHNPSFLNESVICIGDVNGGPSKDVMSGFYDADVVDDQLLFIRDAVLFAAPIDVNTGKLTGDSRMLVAEVVADLSTWKSNFSVSSTGILVFHRDQSGEDPTTAVAADADRVELYARNGRPAVTIADGIAQSTLAMSPDGNTLAIGAYHNDSSTGYDIWLYPVPRPDGTLIEDFRPASRLTFLEGAEANPVFSPDGSEIVFGSIFGSANPGIYRKKIGGGREELILAAARAIELDVASGLRAQNDPAPTEIFPLDWTRDGKHIIYAAGNWIGSENSRIWALPLDGGETFPAVELAEDVITAEVSPNGRWIAYMVVGDQVDPEVYVEPFRPAWEDADATPPEGARWRISLAGGVVPRWAADGEHLYYITVEGTLIEVNVDTTRDVFIHDTGAPLFQIEFEQGMDYVVTRSGEYFAINGLAQSGDHTVNLILNWQGLLKDE